MQTGGSKQALQASGSSLLYMQARKPTTLAQHVEHTPSSAHTGSLHHPASLLLTKTSRPSSFPQRRPAGPEVCWTIFQHTPQIAAADGHCGGGGGDRSPPRPSFGGGGERESELWERRGGGGGGGGGGCCRCTAGWDVDLPKYLRARIGVHEDGQQSDANHDDTQR